jgi:uncharacterized protein (TIGR02996 family)
MTQDEAFLQAILEEPDDDTPRLVYADWLDENGDPDRAEFIRLQLRPPADSDAEHEARAAREKQLLQRHRAEWSRPLHGIRGEWTFRRGFIEQAALEVDVFLQHAPLLFRVVPLRHLAVRNSLNRLRALAGSPHLERLAALDLHGNRVGVAGAIDLASSPHLHRLASLYLDNNDLRAAGLRAFLEHAVLSSLTALDLSLNHVGDEGARALAATAHLPQLTALALRVNDLGVEGIAALAAAAGFVRLTRLDLSFNPLHADGVRVLAGPSGFAGLRELCLGACGLRPGRRRGAGAGVGPPLVLPDRVGP